MPRTGRDVDMTKRGLHSNGERWTELCKGMCWERVCMHALVEWSCTNISATIRVQCPALMAVTAELPSSHLHRMFVLQVRRACMHMSNFAMKSMDIFVWFPVRLYWMNRVRCTNFAVHKFEDTGTIRRLTHGILGLYI